MTPIEILVIILCSLFVVTVITYSIIAKIKHKKTGFSCCCTYANADNSSDANASNSAGAVTVENKENNADNTAEKPVPRSGCSGNCRNCGKHNH